MAGQFQGWPEACNRVGRVNDSIMELHSEQAVTGRWRADRGGLISDCSFFHSRNNVAV